MSHTKCNREEPETAGIVLVLLLGLSLVACVGLYLANPAGATAAGPIPSAEHLEQQAVLSPVVAPEQQVPKPT